MCNIPTLSASSVRHLEVVALTPARLLLVLITDSGRVDQRIVELGDVLDDEDLSRLRALARRRPGRQAAGRGVHRGLGTGRRGPGGSARRRDPVGDGAGRDARRTPRGAAGPRRHRESDPQRRRFLRNQAGFPGSLRAVLEALEEQVVVLKLLAATQNAGTVTVRIGEETQVEQMRGTSVISTGYGAAGTVFGGMGVLGPTRMDYPGTIASVAAVARYIGEVLAER